MSKKSNMEEKSACKEMKSGEKGMAEGVEGETKGYEVCQAEIRDKFWEQGSGSDSDDDKDDVEVEVVEPETKKCTDVWKKDGEENKKGKDEAANKKKKQKEEVSTSRKRTNKEKEEEEVIREEIRRRRDNEDKKREQRERKEKERIEEEERARREEEARAEADEEKSRDTVGGNMREMTKHLEAILQAVSRESGGKISFYKAEQATIRSAVMGVKSVCMGYLAKHVEALEESRSWERKYKKLEKEIEALKKEGRQKRAVTPEEVPRDGNIGVSNKNRIIKGNAVRGQSVTNVESESSEEDLGENERIPYSQVVRGRGRGRGRGAGVRRGFEQGNRGGGKIGYTIEGGQGWGVRRKRSG